MTTFVRSIHMRRPRPLLRLRASGARVWHSLDPADRQALALYALRAGFVATSAIGAAATLGAAWRVFCFASGGC
jgi:hypothetical protein